MSGKRNGKRKKFKKVKPELDSLIERDEKFGFIVGYTSGGAPYGLTHDEMAELEKENNKTENSK